MGNCKGRVKINKMELHGGGWRDREEGKKGGRKGLDTTRS